MTGNVDVVYGDFNFMSGLFMLVGAFWIWTLVGVAMDAAIHFKKKQDGGRIIPESDSESMVTPESITDKKFTVENLSCNGLSNINM